MSPTQRTIAAVGGLAVLAGVGILVTVLASSGDLGTITACTSCGQVGKRLQIGWLEIPTGDAWAVQLEPGMGAVIRGPARFEITGPRPGHRSLALSRGVLFSRVETSGHLIVLMPRSEASSVAGVSASNAVPGSQLDYDAQVTGNALRVTRGLALLQLREGERGLKAGEIWTSGSGPEIPPQPTAQEEAWLDALAPSAAAGSKSPPAPTADAGPGSAR
jgi:hypothetical protein